MKPSILFTLALAFASLSANAENGSPCGRFITCGEYVAEERSDRTAALRDLGEQKVSLEFGREGEGVRALVMKFQDDGVFTLGENGEVGLGICRDLACRISMRPIPYKGDYLVQAVTFRFRENSFVMDKVNVASDGTTSTTHAVFKKK